MEVGPQHLQKDFHGAVGVGDAKDEAPQAQALQSAAARCSQRGIAESAPYRLCAVRLHGGEAGRGWPSESKAGQQASDLSTASAALSSIQSRGGPGGGGAPRPGRSIRSGPPRW